MSTIAKENWQSIESCLDVLKADTEEFESGLRGLFSDLNVMWTELGEQAEAVAERQRELEMQRAEFADSQLEYSQVVEQLELQEVRLKEAMEELGEAKSRLAEEESRLSPPQMNKPRR